MKSCKRLRQITLKHYNRYLNIDVPLSFLLNFEKLKVYGCTVDSSVVDIFNRSSLYDRVNAMYFTNKHTLLGAIPLRMEYIMRKIDIRCRDIYLHISIFPDTLTIHDIPKLFGNNIINTIVNSNNKIEKLVLSIHLISDMYKWRDYINSFPNVKELKIIVHSSEFEPYGEQFLVKHMDKQHRKNFIKHKDSGMEAIELPLS